jgi:Domain of unknown function (DUF4276)
VIRLHAVVEGQTEETFINQVLAPELGARQIFLDAHRVTTGRRSLPPDRGGIQRYVQLKNDLVIWMRQEKGRNVRFTTMVDLYRLPPDFPGYDDCKRQVDPHTRAKCMEDRLQDDIQDNRLVPYIQLHEFEALLFSDVHMFKIAFPDRLAEVQKLKSVRDGFLSPEHIDDQPDQSPSKRIVKVIPEYVKTVSGILIVQHIGLPVLRKECVHFGRWLDRLEQLAPA